MSTLPAGQLTWEERALLKLTESLRTDEVTMQVAAQQFVARFESAWTDPTPEKLSDLVHENAHNLYPGVKAPLNSHGVRRYVRAVLRVAPDMQLRVTRWAARGSDVYIEWTAQATIGRRRLTWRGVDIASLSGEKESASVIYYDSWPLLRALFAQPLVLLRLLLPRLSRWGRGRRRGPPA